MKCPYFCEQEVRDGRDEIFDPLCGFAGIGQWGRKQVGRGNMICWSRKILGHLCWRVGCEVDGKRIQCLMRNRI